jgi:hypothetical protein
VAVLGACAGGCNAPVEVLEELVDVWLAPEEACPPAFALVTYLTVLPGNALAATSVSTPVKRTLPAISQRLIL